MPENYTNSDDDIKEELATDLGNINGQGPNELDTEIDIAKEKM